MVIVKLNTNTPPAACAGRAKPKKLRRITASGANFFTDFSPNFLA
jgi:hypothetical protein